MVRLTRDKPYTLHARSLDRITGTPSDYKLNLRDPRPVLALVSPSTQIYHSFWRNDFL